MIYLFTLTALYPKARHVVRLDKELHSAALGQIEIGIDARFETDRNPFNRFVFTNLPLDRTICRPMILGIKSCSTL